MKMKKIRVLRPEVECTTERPILVRLLLPFFVVRACWAARKYFVREVEITISGKPAGRFWMVLVPKFKVVDAE